MVPSTIRTFLLIAVTSSGESWESFGTSESCRNQGTQRWTVESWFLMQKESWFLVQNPTQSADMNHTLRNDTNFQVPQTKFSMTCLHLHLMNKISTFFAPGSPSFRCFSSSSLVSLTWFPVLVPTSSVDRSSFGLWNSTSNRTRLSSANPISELGSGNPLCFPSILSSEDKSSLCHDICWPETLSCSYPGEPPRAIGGKVFPEPLGLSVKWRSGPVSITKRTSGVLSLELLWCGGLWLKVGVESLGKVLCRGGFSP